MSELSMIKLPLNAHMTIEEVLSYFDEDKKALLEFISYNCKLEEEVNEINDKYIIAQEALCSIETLCEGYLYNIATMNVDQQTRNLLHNIYKISKDARKD